MGRAAHLQGRRRTPACRRPWPSSLDEYLHESQPKLLVVQPIRDEREKDTTKPARSVLVLESFNPPENAEPLVQRLEVVGKHAAPALYNAAEMKRVPLKFLWWPIAKVQEGIGGKGRFIRHRRPRSCSPCSSAA